MFVWQVSENWMNVGENERMKIASERKPFDSREAKSGEVTKTNKL